MALSTEHKIQLVKSYGFELLPRDQAVKAGHAGAFMVKDFADKSDESWTVVGDFQEALLDEAIDAHAMNRYMFGEWEHIVNEGETASSCRVLLDTVEQVVLSAQVFAGSIWKPINKDGLAALLESMNDNDVWSDKELSDDFEKSNEKPDWA